MRSLQRTNHRYARHEAWSLTDGKNARNPPGSSRIREIPLSSKPHSFEQAQNLDYGPNGLNDHEITSYVCPATRLQWREGAEQRTSVSLGYRPVKTFERTQPWRESRLMLKSAVVTILIVRYLPVTHGV
jgi:hypothetical protein